MASGSLPLSTVGLLTSRTRGEFSLLFSLAIPEWGEGEEVAATPPHRQDACFRVPRVRPGTSQER